MSGGHSGWPKALLYLQNNDLCHRSQKWRSKQLKMTKKNWAGRAPTASLAERKRLVSAKDYIIGLWRVLRGLGRKNEETKIYLIFRVQQTATQACFTRWIAPNV